MNGERHKGRFVFSPPAKIKGLSCRIIKLFEQDGKGENFARPVLTVLPPHKTPHKSGVRPKPFVLSMASYKPLSTVI